MGMLTMKKRIHVSIYNALGTPVTIKDEFFIFVGDV